MIWEVWIINILRSIIIVSLTSYSTLTSDAATFNKTFNTTTTTRLRRPRQHQHQHQHQYQRQEHHEKNEHQESLADQKFQQILRQLYAAVPHRQRYQQRRMIEILKDENNNIGQQVLSPQQSTTSESSDSNGSSKWTIECRTQPYFRCPECHAALIQEQSTIIERLREMYPNMIIIAQTHKAFNGIFIELPYDEFLSSSLPFELPGIKTIRPQQQYTMELSETIEKKNERRLKRRIASDNSCYSGKGIVIGVLDTGIDYTHEAFGGNGTLEAFVRAYGSFPSSSRNKRRDGYFPTDTVIEGIDYVGEDPSVNEADDDPIDSIGHGTSVASVILSVSPNAKLIAVKACTSETRPRCPDFALIQGIEYMLDPNGDGNMDDKVDVINLSLNGVYTSAYYDAISATLEVATMNDVVTVASFGNHGNVPYVVDAIGSAFNIMTVAATNHPANDDDDGGGNGNNDIDNDHDNDSGGGDLYMEDYSARGPGEDNKLKPDISATGTSLVAAAGTGSWYGNVRGTSFSAPLVAGAAALLLEKCPECSPLAIRALLMNNADRQVSYSATSTVLPSHADSTVVDSNPLLLAPTTRMGSGNLRVDRAMRASFWGYSKEDVQPSISLGLVDAAHDLVLERHIQVHSLFPSNGGINNNSNIFSSNEAGKSSSSSNNNNNSGNGNDINEIKLSMFSEFRSSEKASSGAVTIRFEPPEIQLQGCGRDENNDSVTFRVLFIIHAQNAPPNIMTTSGSQGIEPYGLDHHEFDGHIVIKKSIDESADVEVEEIAIPFHMILRQAAEPKVAPDTVLPSETGVLDQNVTISNEGMGTAQIDAFEIIYSDGDDLDAGFGNEHVTADVRSIGYRTIKNEQQPSSLVSECDYLVEFNFHFWERVRHAGLHVLKAKIYADLDLAPLILFLPSVPEYSESFIIDRNGTNHCTGLPSDHSSNTANTIMRACSNDLLLPPPLDDGTASDFNFYVSFETYAFPKSISNITQTELLSIPYPNPRIRAHSYDIRPGEVLSSFRVTGFIDDNVLGLQLVSNSFRDVDHTGAATRDTETLMIVKDGINLESEVSPDIFLWPMATNMVGPSCQGWNTVPVTCSGNVIPTTTRTVVTPTTTSTKEIGDDDQSVAKELSGFDTEETTSTSTPHTGQNEDNRNGNDTTDNDCPPTPVLRLVPPTHQPSIPPSNFPSVPTIIPTEVPTQDFTNEPTAIPVPSSAPPTSQPPEPSSMMISSTGPTDNSDQNDNPFSSSSSSSSSWTFQMTTNLLWMINWFSFINSCTRLLLFSCTFWLLL